jgi:hypothetical protein
MGENTYALMVGKEEVVLKPVTLAEMKQFEKPKPKISVVAIVFTKTEVDQPREMPRTPANLSNDCKDFS